MEGDAPDPFKADGSMPTDFFTPPGSGAPGGRQNPPPLNLGQRGPSCPKALGSLLVNGALDYLGGRELYAGYKVARGIWTAMRVNRAMRWRWAVKWNVADLKRVGLSTAKRYAFGPTAVIPTDAGFNLAYDASNGGIKSFWDVAKSVGLSFLPFYGTGKAVVDVVNACILR